MFRQSIETGIISSHKNILRSNCSSLPINQEEDFHSSLEPLITSPGAGYLPQNDAVEFYR